MSGWLPLWTITPAMLEGSWYDRNGRKYAIFITDYKIVGLAHRAVLLLLNILCIVVALYQSDLIFSIEEVPCCWISVLFSALRSMITTLKPIIVSIARINQTVTSHVIYEWHDLTLFQHVIIGLVDTKSVLVVSWGFDGCVYLPNVASHSEHMIRRT